MSRLAVAELLDEFGVREPADYHRLEPGRRPMFERRLYRTLQARFAPTLRTVQQADGLTLHFEGREEDDGTVGNLPDEALVRKLALYADRVLVTFPFREVPPDVGRDAVRVRQPEGAPVPLLWGEVETRRTLAGGQAEATGTAHAVEPAAFDAFLALLCQLKPAIALGIVQVLPLFADGRRALHRHRRHALPLALGLEGLRDRYAADGVEEVVTEPGAIPALYLPTFDDLPLETVAAIRQEDTAARGAFQEALRALLDLAESVDSTETLVGYLRRVDDEAAELAHRVRSARRRASPHPTGPAETGLLPGLPPTAAGPLGLVAAGLRTILAGITGAGYVRPLSRSRQEGRASAAQEVFLPWRIHAAAREAQAGAAAVAEPPRMEPVGA